MMPTVIAAVVLLVMVTGMGALSEPTGTFPNARVLADADMVKPTPVSEMVCVPVWSLSVIVTVPATGPGTVGLKVMLMAQDPPFAIGALVQLLVCWNGPVTATLLTVSAVVLALLSMTTVGALVVPTIRLPKFKVSADRPTPL